jgi:NRPS condensation-like uncharacterized protein
MPKCNNQRYKAETWDIMQLLFAKFNDHQIHCVIQMDAQLDEIRLKHAIDLLTDAFPLLRCRFVESRGTAYWEDTGFSADDIMFLQETENTEEEIQKTICSKTNEFIGPQLRIHIIRGKDADSLCIIINHMLCDGAGFKELLYLLSFFYSHLKDDPGYKPVFKNASRSARQVLQAFDLKSRMKIIFQRYGLSRYDDSIVLSLEGDRSTPFIVTHTISQERFLSAKSFAKQYSATVNDVILTAYIRTLHKILPGKTMAIQCVLDLRKFLPGKKAEGICNLTSNLVCNIGTDIGEKFSDTLIKVKLAMDTEKDQVSCLHLILLLETVFRVIPYQLAKRIVSKAYHNPPLAMSNIGIIDQKRLSFDCIPIRSAFITGSIKYNPLFQLALSTFRDEVTLSVAFHGTHSDQDKIRSFLKMIDEELPSKNELSLSYLKYN